MPEKIIQSKPADKKPNGGISSQVAERIKDSDNVLVALSKNPSVDELSAALGLTFILDKLGKHATAIFSGAVPNAIEFLEPEKTFESNTNSLQDFIIALDKDKADHLRYKIEGDFVKVYITPYKTTLSEKDLEFTHGDYNVDLIVALNVNTESDLDSALSEYGKIKHDASSINISAAAPGKFGDLEWGDPGASSVSEMIANLAELLDDGKGEEKLLDKPTATALLAGIVAATNRFSNERTSAETMTVAANLMSDGADQQLISSSIPVDILTNDTVDMNKEVAALDQEESAPAEESAQEPVAEEAPVEEQPVEEQPIEAPAPAPVEEQPAETQPEEKSAAALALERMQESVKRAEGKIDFDEIEEMVVPKPENIPDLPAPEPAPIEPADETPTAPENAPEIETTAVPAPAEAAPIDLPTPELEPQAAPIIPVAPAQEGIVTDRPEQISEPASHPDSASVSNEKTLVPPSEAEMAPRPVVDYAAEMAQALSGPAPAIAPTELPVAEMAPIAAPVAAPDAYIPENAEPVVPAPVINEAMQAPVTTPPVADFQPAPNVDPTVPPIAPMGVDPNSAEYITPPLPMPSDGSLLPPPPAPFALDGTPAPAPQPIQAPAEAIAAAPAMPAAAPTAQEFAQGIQNDMQAQIAAAPVEPIMPAVLQEEDEPTMAPAGGVMQDQVYADPSAFHIPGM